MNSLTPQQIRSFSDRLSSRADMFQEAFIDSMFAGLPDIFDATVLTVNSPFDSDGTKIQVGGQSYIIVRVRPQRAINFIYPNPGLAACADIQKKLINLHPQCIIEMDPSMEVPNAGSIIECRRIKESNSQKAVLLSTKIKFQSSEAETLESQRISARNAFMGTAAVPLSQTNGAGGTKPPRNTSQEAAVIYTLENYKDFAIALMPLLDNIGAHESRSAGYDAFNCGKADGGKTCDTQVTLAFAGKLSTHTIGEIRTSQDKRKEAEDRNGLFAVGRYQLITKTLKGALTNLPDLKPADIFNKTVQDPLGAYLCLSAKRKVLHGFLIDKHNDAEKAAHELAEEWASYPSQYTYIRKVKRKGKFVDLQVTRGKSVYSNDSAGNAARKNEKPETVVEMMKRVKTQFLNNAKVKQILGIP